MKLCADKLCERHGIALTDSEFPRNAYYDTRGVRDGLGIYCRQCAARRTAEYRWNLAEIHQRSRKAKIPLSQIDQIKNKFNEPTT